MIRRSSSSSVAIAVSLSQHALAAAGARIVVAARARRAFDLLPPEQLVLAPDCGLKYLPRESAYGKMRALVDAAKRLRAELRSSGEGVPTPR